MQARSVVVNLQPRTSIPVIKVSQYDIGVPLSFVVYDGSVPASFSSGTSVTFEMTRPSGVGVVTSCSIAGNVVSKSTTLDMTREAGDITAELRFASGGTDVGTCNFTFVVEEAAHPDGTIDADTEALEAIAQQVHADTVQSTNNASTASSAAASATASANSASQNAETAVAAARSAALANQSAQEAKLATSADAVTASNSASVATTAANTATAKATLASQSASTASAKASQAESSANTASSAATTATNAKDVTVDARDTAVAAKDDAVQAKTDAQTAKEAAEEAAEEAIEALDSVILKEISDGADLNDYYETGRYIIIANPSSIIGHFPTDNISSAFMDVFSFPNGYVIQNLVISGTGYYCVRRRYNSGLWSEWSITKPGLDDDVKNALLNIFEHVVYKDGENAYDELMYFFFPDSGLLYSLVDRVLDGNTKIDTGVAVNETDQPFTIIVEAKDESFLTNNDGTNQMALLSGVEQVNSSFIGPKVFVSKLANNAKRYTCNSSGSGPYFDTDNGTHHCIAIIKYRSQTMSVTLYVDGKLVNTISYSTPELYHHNTIKIGDDDTEYDRYWVGRVIKAYVYGNYLSDNKISKLIGGIQDKSFVYNLPERYFSTGGVNTGYLTNSYRHNFTIVGTATDNEASSKSALEQRSVLASIVSITEGFCGAKVYVNHTSTGKTYFINCEGLMASIQTDSGTHNIKFLMRYIADNNGGNGSVKVYLSVDEQVQEANGNATKDYTHSQPLIVGFDVAEASGRAPWIGNIAITIYSRAFTDEEVTAYIG